MDAKDFSTLILAIADDRTCHYSRQVTIETCLTHKQIEGFEIRCSSYVAGVSKEEKVDPGPGERSQKLNRLAKSGLRNWRIARGWS